jgi:hypothetical protein
MNELGLVAGEERAREEVIEFKEISKSAPFGSEIAALADKHGITLTIPDYIATAQLRWDLVRRSRSHFKPDLLNNPLFRQSGFEGFYADQSPIQAGLALVSVGHQLRHIILERFQSDPKRAEALITAIEKGEFDPQAIADGHNLFGAVIRQYRSQIMAPRESDQDPNLVFQKKTQMIVEEAISQGKTYTISQSKSKIEETIPIPTKNPHDNPNPIPLLEYHKSLHERDQRALRFMLNFGKFGSASLRQAVAVIPEISKFDTVESRDLFTEAVRNITLFPKITTSESLIGQELNSDDKVRLFTIISWLAMHARLNGEHNGHLPELITLRQLVETYPGCDPNKIANQTLIDQDINTISAEDLISLAGENKPITHRLSRENTQPTSRNATHTRPEQETITSPEAIMEKIQAIQQRIEDISGDHIQRAIAATSPKGKLEIAQLREQVEQLRIKAITLPDNKEAEKVTAEQLTESADEFEITYINPISSALMGLALVKILAEGELHFSRDERKQLHRMAKIAFPYTISDPLKIVMDTVKGLENEFSENTEGTNVLSTINELVKTVKNISQRLPKRNPRNTTSTPFSTVGSPNEKPPTIQELFGRIADRK